MSASNLSTTTDPLQVYQQALRCYDTERLRTVAAALGIDTSSRPTAVVVQIVDRIAEPRIAVSLLADLETPARVAMGLVRLTEQPIWPAVGLAHSLRCLGLEPGEAVRPLLERGLMAILVDGASPTDSDFVEWEAPTAIDRYLVAHPGAVAESRTVLPPGAGPPVTHSVRQVRESDGLEFLLRMAAMWQRVASSPLRQTQNGNLFKKDRDRLDDDPTLVGPISDSIEPLPDMAALWLELAMHVGLIVPESGSDRLVASSADYWSENAVHLPQMVSQGWMNLRSWHELAGWQGEEGAGLLAVAFTRPSVLLWLATLAENEWVALDDLRNFLNERNPDWSRLLLSVPSGEVAGLDGRSRPRASATRRVGPNQGGLLEAILLGPAFQLGLVRFAEAVPDGRRVVQLTTLGCYALALGLPPSRRDVFDQFLIVQPNFEVIAYRQGLTPGLIGQLSRFMHWSQLGAALELRLTSEAAYRGLEGGMTVPDMLDRLTRHSARSLPPSVPEAIRTWAERRERVTFHPSATLIEFLNAADLESALVTWTQGAPPVRITDRLLLVDEIDAIPFKQFRTLGARDYRSEAEACIEVEPDGVTLTVDPGRSDLFIEAELERLAEPIAFGLAIDRRAGSRRRYRITLETISRAVSAGLGPSQFDRWFLSRAGTSTPAAAKLLLYAADGPREPPVASRRLVLTVPSADLLDGLCQHPATRDYLGDRLGPTAIAVPDALWDSLRLALQRLGLEPRIEFI